MSDYRHHVVTEGFNTEVVVYPMNIQYRLSHLTLDYANIKHLVFEIVQQTGVVNGNEFSILVKYEGDENK